MALLDFLKKKKDVEKAKEKKPSFAKATEGKEKPEKVSVAPGRKPMGEAKEVKTPKSKKETKGFSYEAVREPHISEKSTNLGVVNQYVFKVHHDANKPAVKKAVEGIYHVDVLSVNMIKVPKKKRRLGRTEGFRKGYTKAVVTIKEGQKIDLF